MRIYKTIRGRLGNIMFDVACGKYIARKYNCRELYFIASDEEKKVVRSYDFFNDIHFISVNESTLNKAKLVEEMSSIDYTEISLPTDSNMTYVILGDRQSPLYWDNDYGFIKELYQPTQRVLKKISTKYADLDFSKAFSIHIRRTDYLDNDMYRSLSANEVNELIGRYEDDTKFVIFSDDIEWCRKSIKGGNVTFAEGNDDETDLWLMSMCSRGIISNSTFSWWASYLNPNKTTYYSMPWYTSNASEDIIPKLENWKRIL